MGIFPVMCVKSGKCMAYPDVCLTNTPAGPQPIPYPNVAEPADGDGTDKVKTMNCNTLRQGDEISRTSGDNAGNAPGGVVGGRYAAVAKITTGDPGVKADGKAVAFHTVTTEHNGANPNAVGAHLTPTQVKVKVKGAPRTPGNGFDSLHQGGVIAVGRALRQGAHPLNDGADRIRCSPTATAQAKHLQEQGYKFAYDPRGSHMTRNPKYVGINPTYSNQPDILMRSTSHEMGHAMYTPLSDFDAAKEALQRAPRNPNGKIARADFREAFLIEKGGRDEGAATLNNSKVSEESRRNCGNDVPISSATVNNPARYRQIANGPGSETDKQRQIGKIFHDTESAGHRYSDQWQSNWGQYADDFMNVNPRHF